MQIPEVCALGEEENPDQQFYFTNGIDQEKRANLFLQEITSQLLPLIPKTPEIQKVQKPKRFKQNQQTQQIPNQQYQQQQQQIIDIESQESNTFSNGDDDEINLEKFNSNPKGEGYDLENNLTFEIRTLYKLETILSSSSQYLPGMISIKTKESQLGQQKQERRVGVDLIYLIDKSGSMQGKKMMMVKQTLNVLLEFLTEKDRLQLITFGSSAQRLTPLKIIKDSNKQQIKTIIKSIMPSGGTNISTATAMAIEQLQNRKEKNNVTSIFILSDGQDESAESNLFEQLKNIDEILTINSFGFGGDHDAKMMSSLSNLGKGSFYFVQNINLLDEFFADALGGLISVVGTEISIDVSCKPAVPFQDIYMAKTYSKVWIPVNDQREYQITIPQISSGSRKDFLFEIKLPTLNIKLDDEFRNAKLIEATIKIKNPINGKLISKEAQSCVTFFNQGEHIENNEQDIDVLVQYFRVKATEVIEEARKKCDQNKNEEGQKIIGNMIVAIKQSNEAAFELSQGIIQDLQQAKQGASKESYYLFVRNKFIVFPARNLSAAFPTTVFLKLVIIQPDAESLIKKTGLILIE